MGNRDAAIQELRDFFRSRQDDPVACYALGNALMGLGDYDQAVLALRRVLQLDDDVFEAHRDLGVVLALRGDRKEAIAALRSALRIQPYDPQTKANLTLLQADRGVEIQPVGAAGYPSLVSTKPAARELRVDPILGEVRLP